MNRQEKVSVVQSMEDLFSNSQASFLVNYRGLDVEQMHSLRRDVKNSGGVMKVAKARLARRAVQSIDESFTALVPLLKDQLAFIFARTDVAALAKSLVDFSKKNEQLKLVGGVFDSSLLNDADIARIASLPSRDVLLALLVGTIQSPITQTARVLHVMLARFVWVLKKIEEKKATAGVDR